MAIQTRYLVRQPSKHRARPALPASSCGSTAVLARPNADNAAPSVTPICNRVDLILAQTNMASIASAAAALLRPQQMLG